MSIYNYTEKTKKSLLESGWFENKQFDTSKYFEYLFKNDFIIHETVKTFLNSFGGLIICFDRDGEQDDIEFEVFKAIDDFHPNWLKKHYPKRTNTILCPIGVAYRGYMVVSMDEYGQVFAGLDDTLIRLGKSGEEAINNVCNDYKGLIIEID